MKNQNDETIESIINILEVFNLTIQRESDKDQIQKYPNIRGLERTLSTLTAFEAFAFSFEDLHLILDIPDIDALNEALNHLLTISQELESNSKPLFSLFKKVQKTCIITLFNLHKKSSVGSDCSWEAPTMMRTYIDAYEGGELEDFSLYHQIINSPNGRVEPEDALDTLISNIPNSIVSGRDIEDLQHTISPEQRSKKLKDIENRKKLLETKPAIQKFAKYLTRAQQNELERCQSPDHLDEILSALYELDVFFSFENIKHFLKERTTVSYGSRISFIFNIGLLLQFSKSLAPKTPLFEMFQKYKQTCVDTLFTIYVTHSHNNASILSEACKLIILLIKMCSEHSLDLEHEIPQVSKMEYYDIINRIFELEKIKLFKPTTSTKQKISSSSPTVMSSYSAPVNEYIDPTESERTNADPEDTKEVESDTLLKNDVVSSTSPAVNEGLNQAPQGDDIIESIKNILGELCLPIQSEEEQNYIQQNYQDLGGLEEALTKLLELEMLTLSFDEFKLILKNPNIWPLITALKELLGFLQRLKPNVIAADAGYNYYIDVDYDYCAGSGDDDDDDDDEKLLDSFQNHKQSCIHTLFIMHANNASNALICRASIFMTLLVEAHSENSFKSDLNEIIMQIPQMNEQKIKKCIVLFEKNKKNKQKEALEPSQIDEVDTKTYATSSTESKKRITVLDEPGTNLTELKVQNVQPNTLLTKLIEPNGLSEFTKMVASYIRPAEATNPVESSAKQSEPSTKQNEPYINLILGFYLIELCLYLTNVFLYLITNTKQLKKIHNDTFRVRFFENRKVTSFEQVVIDAVNKCLSKYQLNERTHIHWSAIEKDVKKDVEDTITRSKDNVTAHLVETYAKRALRNQQQTTSLTM